MAESVSELESKILRLQVRYDGMSDARVAEKKALEDQIRALRDQLDELRPPSRVDPQGVRNPVGHDAPPDDPVAPYEFNFDDPDPVGDPLSFVVEASLEVDDPRHPGARAAREKAAAARAAAATKAEADANAARDRWLLEHPAAAELERETPGAIAAGSAGAVGKDVSTKKMIDESQRQGCLTSPKVLAGIGIGAAVVIAVILVVLNSGSDDKAKTSAGAGTNAAADASDSSAGPMDGHWVLTSGLQEPTGKDTSLQGLGTGTSPPGWTVTLDKSSATIDISGDKITGGTYTTGITGANGDSCQTLQSKVDLKASGGVDQTVRYGQLILDGTSTTTKGCDSNHQSIVETVPNYHTAHFFYFKDDALFLCYSINSTTFDSCTDPAGGSAATFQRG
ncbi:MAG: hypothetical protein QOJ80_6235 [Mycobacterium sp.]|nr:hypothetical protein [Mycobacterium sp.]